MLKVKVLQLKGKVCKYSQENILFESIQSKSAQGRKMSPLAVILKQPTS